MTQLTAMHAVVKVLESEGVETVFGVPDPSLAPLYDGLRGSSIRRVTARDGERAANAADGYSRATGRVGVCVGTLKPTDAHLVAGLHTAMSDSVPLLAITAQTPAPHLDRHHLGAVDVGALVRSVVKRSYLADRPEPLPWVLRDAFRLAREGRPGPVHVTVPTHVLAERVAYAPDADAPLGPHRTAPNPLAIERALDLLLAADRPLLLPGGGVVSADAAAELVELAERLQIPVLPTLMGWGTIPDDHPLYAGLAGVRVQTRAGNEALLDADLVLAIGARFAEHHTGDLDVYRGDRTFIHIDVDPTELGRVFGPDLGIVGDAQLALRALLEGARRRVGPGRDGNAWAARVPHRRAALARRDDHDETPIKPQRVFRELNRHFDARTVFVTAIDVYDLVSGQFQEAYHPRQHLIRGRSGPPGWELAACTGAKLARPDATVVGVVSDRTALTEELAVAARHAVPFVVVLLDAAGRTDDVPGTDALARRVERPDSIGAALDWAIETSERHRRPALVDVAIERAAAHSAHPSLMVSCIPDVSSVQLR